MTTPARPRPAVSNHPTRRQLDELDALMQRMLALPVNPQDEDASEPATHAPAPGSTPLQAPSGQSTLVEQEVVTPAAAKLENQGSVKQGNEPGDASCPATMPLAPATREQALKENLSTPLVLGSPRLAPLANPDTKPPSPARASQRPQRQGIDAPPPGWWLWPFLWCDRAFVSSTTWLGPLGRGLRGPWGRTLLGLAGFLMLAAALALLTLDRMGWTW